MKTNLVNNKTTCTAILVVLMALLQANSFCQDKQDPGKPHPPTTEERMKIVQEKIIKPLSLNTTQSQTVTQAFMEFFTAADNARKNQKDMHGPLDKSIIGPIEKTRDDKISKVLTKDQFTKYLELEKAARPPKPGNQDPPKK